MNRGIENSDRLGDRYWKTFSASVSQIVGRLYMSMSMSMYVSHFSGSCKTCQRQYPSAIVYVHCMLVIHTWCTYTVCQ